MAPLTRAEQGVDSHRTGAYLAEHGPAALGNGRFHQPPPNPFPAAFVAAFRLLNAADLRNLCGDVRYEIEMLRYAYRSLNDRRPRDEREANVYIEAFWLHARNLYEFLFVRSDDDKYLKPEHFLAEVDHDRWRDAPVPDKRGNTLRLMNTFVSHLGRERRTLAKQALADGRDEVHDEIEAAMQQFLSMLPPERLDWFTNSP